MGENQADQNKKEEELEKEEDGGVSTEIKGLIQEMREKILTKVDITETEPKTGTDPKTGTENRTFEKINGGVKEDEKFKQLSEKEQYFWKAQVNRLISFEKEGKIYDTNQYKREIQAALDAITKELDKDLGLFKKIKKRFSRKKEKLNTKTEEHPVELESAEDPVTKYEAIKKELDEILSGVQLNNKKLKIFNKKYKVNFNSTEIAWVVYFVENMEVSEKEAIDLEKEEYLDLPKEDKKEVTDNADKSSQVEQKDANNIDIEQVFVGKDIKEIKEELEAIESADDDEKNTKLKEFNKKYSEENVKLEFDLDKVNLVLDLIKKKEEAENENNTKDVISDEPEEEVKESNTTESTEELDLEISKQFLEEIKGMVQLNEKLQEGLKQLKEGHSWSLGYNTPLTPERKQKFIKILEKAADDEDFKKMVLKEFEEKKEEE